MNSVFFSRRKFLQTTGSALGGGLIFSSATQAAYGSGTDPSGLTEKPQWLVELVGLNDSRFDDFPKFLKENRVNDESDPHFGGFLDHRFGLPTVGATNQFIRTALCSMLTPESHWYHSGQLLQAVTEASEHLLYMQHDDGSIDLINHNFFSPPDTAFIVRNLAPLYGIFLDEEIPGSQRALENIRSFLDKASLPLLDGGIHTPNHRWVFCAALGRLYELWPEEKYRIRAEQWLVEGIDMDDDGQYRERDMIYTAVSNRALLTTSNAFDKPELLDYVRRSLDMLLYYVTSTGEMAEEISERVERDGRSLRDLSRFYIPFRSMAIRDDNGVYASMCRLIERRDFERLTGNLYQLLVDRDLWEPLPVSKPMPRSYEKEFKNSGIVRVRRGNYDASIISRYARQGIFFTYHKTDAVLWGMRLGSSFSGMGQFVAQDIRRENDEWVLERKVDGLYFQPLPEEHIPLGMGWEFDEKYSKYGLMWDTTNRELTRIHTLRQLVQVREIDNGFELDVTVDGTDYVPTAIELIFRPGGRFSGVEKHPNLNDIHFLKEGYGQYHVGRNTITFGPGSYKHHNVELRGTLPGIDFPTVVLTGVSPFRHTIRLT